MWALRRAASVARKHDSSFMIAQAAYAIKPVAPMAGFEHPDRRSCSNHHVYGLCVQAGNIYVSPFSTAKLTSSFKGLSSQSGEMGKQMVSEDDFCDLDAALGNRNESSIVDEADYGPLVSKEFRQVDSKGNLAEPTDKCSRKRDIASPLLTTLMMARPDSLSISLSEWINQGNSLSRADVSVAMIHLRRRRLYNRALQFVEWLESTKFYNFLERDYACHLNLVAKTQGLQEAEIYLDKVPEACKGEIVYRTLLANCVAPANVDKAEEVFHRMRDLGFSISAFAYTQLLLLYRKTNRKKIPDVLLIMEKDNVKPTLLMYTILIDVKGLSRDMVGMEKVLESMKAEGMVPDNALRAMVARHYISAGFNTKAEKTIKEIENDCCRGNSDAWRFLLPLYATQGKVDDVKRVWKSFEASACIDDFVSAIQAWGKLGLVEEAETFFDKMTKKWEKIPTRCYNALLKVYANHGLLSKGKDLAKTMSEAGCWVGPLTWDALVKLFVKAGEVEKADSMLQKAAARKRNRPLYGSYITLLDKYAEMGDVHNAEKIFDRLRLEKYRRNVNQYQLLAKAYKNAGTPAYGFRERMKADNVFPGKIFFEELATYTKL